MSDTKATEVGLPRTNGSRAAGFAKSASLTLGGLLAGIALVELVVFPYYLAVIPTNLWSLTARFGRQLAQSSKAGVIPHDYILLTGDSYAEGQGDALDSARPGTREAYASAHFIHAQLGRDVLSVGRGGWSSVSSALAPNLFAEQARLSVRFTIPPPAMIVYYFYEGNDLDDNLVWAMLGRGADFGARLYSATEVEALLRAQRDSDSSLGEMLERFASANFQGTTFMARASHELLKLLQRRLFQGGSGERPVPRTGGGFNKAVVGGATVDLPDRLQAPALFLTETELSNSVLALRKSLEFMKAASPGVPVTVVYIPSPLASYDLATDEVSYQKTPGPRGDAGRAAAALVPERQFRLRRMVCEIARDLGFAFADATPAIRSAGRRQILHGPRDWTHFNLDGYRILGTVVADFLAKAGHLRDPVDCVPVPP